MLIKIFLFFLFFLNLYEFCILHGVKASEDEFRLLKNIELKIKDLRENYDPVERPVANHSEPIHVDFKIYLQQILDVDEKNQLVTLVVWLQFGWLDYKMKWDPKEYGGINSIVMPPDALWKPDLVLFNSADENFDARFGVNFVVENNGKILHTPPAIVKSSCRIDITWFPFDEQICYLKYGSWTYKREKLNLFIDDSYNKIDSKHLMDVSYYVPNGEWELVATPAIKKVTEFEKESYVELFFYLHIRRKTIYYGMNWIVPSILFLLSNVLGFTMPAECGEKITLQTTNLLSVTVFLGMVADVTPPTSTSVPIIAAFFSVSMVILASSIIFTLLIINVHFRSPKTHEMEPWVKKIFLEWLPWLLLMKRPGMHFKRPKPSEQKGGSSGGCSRRSSRRSHASSLARFRVQPSTDQLQQQQPLLLQGDVAEQPPQLVQQRRQQQMLTVDSASFGTQQTFGGGGGGSLGAAPWRGEKSMGVPADGQMQALFRNTLQEVSDFLKLSLEKMDENDEEEQQRADWRFMAMALDRACLFFYALLIFALFIWIFAATPSPSIPPTNITNILHQQENGP